MTRMKQAALAIAAAAVLSLSAPAFAMDEMKAMSAADCKSMMSSMSAMGNKDMAIAKTKMTGSGDHDSAMMMGMMGKHMMMTAKYESKCAATEKMRSDAADLMKSLGELQEKYPQFMHSN